MTHELPSRPGSTASAATAARQHTRKHASLLSTSTSDSSVGLRIRRRCHKRLQPLDIPHDTTDDSRDALSFRWWALPSPSVTKRQSRKVPDAVVSITIVPPALASLAASLSSSLESSLATGLASSRIPSKVVLPGSL